jgi:hypothetical protein
MPVVRNTHYRESFSLASVRSGMIAGQLIPAARNAAGQPKLTSMVETD